MSASSFTFLIYLFGFVGLASIGLLPFRAWQTLRGLSRSKSFPISRTASFVFIALIAAVALWADVQVTARIFKCLTGRYCGPTIAGGWIYLAMLGVVYFVFEAAVLGMQRISRAKAINPAA
ncbi:hypothetical protein ACLB90_09905 [Stenotrophomonas sp. LGBM10]|uniref:hypothetical protein n=1 Tax=Stenotrophomonas sp. LGBM10 TaxID=3390038 RepID=UPI00398A8497